MTHYAELSRYSYSKFSVFSKEDPKWGDTKTLSCTISNTVNVAWLGEGHDFPAGETSHDFQERLLEFCFYRNTFNPTRGFHICELPNCPLAAESPGSLFNGPSPVQRGEDKAWLNTAEIRVLGPKKVYAAPTMIYHYVVDPHYLPPQEFIDAVLTSPTPDTPEFWARYEKLEKVQRQG